MSCTDTTADLLRRNIIFWNLLLFNLEKFLQNIHQDSDWKIPLLPPMSRLLIVLLCIWSSGVGVGEAEIIFELKIKTSSQSKGKKSCSSRQSRLVINYSNYSKFGQLIFLLPAWLALTTQHSTLGPLNTYWETKTSSFDGDPPRRLIFMLDIIKSCFSLIRILQYWTAWWWYIIWKPQ